MSSSATVPDGEPRILLESVSLCYRLARQRLPSFKDYAIHWMRGALVYEQLWALKEVSLALHEGESVGVIGRNGAGKSTLLKVICKVLKPVRGQVTVRGQVAPLLELGTGFDHELTGRENVYLNALLLGHRHREIRAKLEEIVEFSGLGELIHSPLRNYSSGMIARLGFAIATAWLPQILLVDEILAVGDAAFTRKCEERMSQFQRSGVTVLLVSHNLDAIHKGCTRCLWLDGGQLRADGPTAEVIDLYTRSFTPGALA